MLLILPIGHERREVRRFPYVSFAIIAVNVLAFLLTYVRDGPQSEARLSAALQAVQEYLYEHPYLRLDPELERNLFSARQRREIEAELAALRELRPQPPPEPVVEAQQGELDQRCRAVLKALDSSYAFRWGYIPARGGAARLLTSMFLHGGWLHLIFNMLFFSLSGPFIEDVYGRVIFPLLYVSGGAVAAWVHAAKYPGSTVPLIGASGAIAALMGAFLVRYARTRIRFAYLFVVFIVRIYRGTFWAPAYVMLPLWLLQQLIEAGLQGESAGVAFWAHIGGFVFGAVFAFAILFTRVEERFVAPSIEASITLERHPGLTRGVEALSAGRLKQARFHLGQALKDQPRDPDVHLELYRAELGLGDRAAAARHAAQNIALELGAGRTDSALATYREAREALPELRLPPTQMLALARAAERPGDPAEALATYEALAAAAPREGTAARALANAALLHERMGDLGAAVEALGRAAMVPGIDPDLATELAARIPDLAARAGVAAPAVPRVQPRGLPPPVAGPPKPRRR